MSDQRRFFVVRSINIPSLTKDDKYHRQLGFYLKCNKGKESFCKEEPHVVIKKGQVSTNVSLAPTTSWHATFDCKLKQSMEIRMTLLVRESVSTFTTGCTASRDEGSSETKKVKAQFNNIYEALFPPSATGAALPSATTKVSAIFENIGDIELELCLLSDEERLQNEADALIKKLEAHATLLRAATKETSKAHQRLLEVLKLLCESAAGSDAVGKKLEGLKLQQAIDFVEKNVSPLVKGMTSISEQHLENTTGTFSPHRQQLQLPDTFATVMQALKDQFGAHLGIANRVEDNPLSAHAISNAKIDLSRCQLLMPSITSGLTDVSLGGSAAVLPKLHLNSLDSTQIPNHCEEYRSMRRLRDTLEAVGGSLGTFVEAIPLGALLVTAAAKIFNGLLQARELRRSASLVADRVSILLSYLNDQRLAKIIAKDKHVDGLRRSLVLVFFRIEEIGIVIDHFVSRGSVMQCLTSESTAKELSTLDEELGKTFSQFHDCLHLSFMFELSDLQTLLSQVLRISSSEDTAASTMMEGLMQKLDAHLAHQQKKTSEELVVAIKAIQSEQLKNLLASHSQQLVGGVSQQVQCLQEAMNVTAASLEATLQEQFMATNRVVDTLKTWSLDRQPHAQAQESLKQLVTEAVGEHERIKRRNNKQAFYYTLDDDRLLGENRGPHTANPDALRRKLSEVYKKRFKDFETSTGSQGMLAEDMFTTLTLTEALGDFSRYDDKDDIISTKFNAMDVLDAAKCDSCRCSANLHRLCPECNRVLLVEGRAGIGKTTLAKQMARLQKQKYGFCIFVSLPDVKDVLKNNDSTTISALQLIGMSLQEQCTPFLGTAPINLVEAIWASGEPIIWLLDGYDEAAHHKQEDSCVARFLQEFIPGRLPSNDVDDRGARRFYTTATVRPNDIVIVTSREERSGSALNKAPLLRIDPWRFEQIREFVKKYFESVSSLVNRQNGRPRQSNINFSKSQRDAGENTVLSAIQRNVFGPMTQIPIICEFMCFVVVQAINNNECLTASAERAFASPAALYKQVLHGIYRVNAQKKNSCLHKVDVEEVFQLARQKAFECTKAQNVFFRVTNDFVVDTDVVDAFIDSGLVRCVNRGDDTYQFMHKSLMEYFAAEYLFENITEMSTATKKKPTMMSRKPSFKSLLINSGVPTRSNSGANLSKMSLPEAPSGPSSLKLSHDDCTLSLHEVVRRDLAALSVQYNVAIGVKTDEDIRTMIENAEHLYSAVTRDQIRRRVVHDFFQIYCRKPQIEDAGDDGDGDCPPAVSSEPPPLIDVNDMCQQRNMLVMLAHMIAAAKKDKSPNYKKQYEVFTKTVCGSFGEHVEFIKEGWPEKDIRRTPGTTVSDGNDPSTPLHHKLIAHKNVSTELMDVFRSYCGCSTIVEIATAFEECAPPENLPREPSAAMREVGKKTTNCFLDDLLCCESTSSRAPRRWLHFKHLLKRCTGAPDFITWLLKPCVEQDAFGTFFYFCATLGVSECRRFMAEGVFHRYYITALQHGATSIANVLKTCFCAELDIKVAVSLGAANVVKKYLEDHAANESMFTLCLTIVIRAKRFRVLQSIMDASRNMHAQKPLDHLMFCSTTLPHECVMCTESKTDLIRVIWHVLRNMSSDDEKTAFVLGVVELSCVLSSPDIVTAYCPRSADHVVMPASLSDDAVEAFRLKHRRGVMKSLHVYGSVNKTLTPSILKLCSGLTSISFENCDVAPEDLLFVESPSLQRLDVQCVESYDAFKDNKHHHTADMVPVSFPQLEHLSITNCASLTDDQLHSFVSSGSQQLRLVNISGCTKVTDVGLKAVVDHHGEVLKALNVSRCREMSNDGVEEVAKKCPNLAQLDISYCCKLGNVGVQALAGGNLASTLRHFNVSCCHHISDAELAVIAQTMTMLEHLDVSHCTQITDVGMHHIAKLSHLQRLDVSYCRSVSAAGISYLAMSFISQTLEYLNLARCDKIANDALQKLATFSHLQDLDLQGCFRITDVGLKQFVTTCEVNKVPLRHLNLHYCGKLSHRGLRELSKLKDLRRLTLCWCKGVTNGVLEQLGMLKHLEHLDISCCEAVSDSGLKYLVKLAQLRHLNLHKCQKVTNGGLKHVAGLSQLVHLDISNCVKVTDAGLKHIAQLYFLRYLNMQWCPQITDKGFEYLSTAVMDVTNNKANSAISALKLSQLQRLDLQHCDGVSMFGIRHLANPTQLQRLVVDYSTTSSSSSSTRSESSGLLNSSFVEHMVEISKLCVVLTLPNIR